MKAFLRPHRFRHLYPVRFYTTKTQSGRALLPIAAVQNDGGRISAGRKSRHGISGFQALLRFAWLSKFFAASAAIEHR